MGTGLRITTVFLLFLVLYILFGVIYSALAGTDFLGELSSDIKGSLILVVSWPSFIFLLGGEGGSMGAFIASSIIFAIIVILFWVSHLIEKLLFPRNNGEENEDEEHPTKNNARKNGNSNNINHKEEK